MQQRTFEEVRESLRGKVILVANRGIPARRISRSIRERFEAIAAITATDIDKTEPAAASAQELILLGADPRAYLDLPRIIRLARERGCVAIHPGWGFASEDNNFPKLCAEAGITFPKFMAPFLHQSALRPKRCTSSAIRSKHAAWPAASAFRWSRVPTNLSTFRARERSFMKLVFRSCSRPRAAAADAAFSS